MGELRKNWRVWKWLIGAALFIGAWAVAASLDSSGLIALGLVLAFAVPMQVGVHVYPLAERRKDAEEEKREAGRERGVAASRLRSAARVGLGHPVE